MGAFDAWVRCMTFLPIVERELRVTARRRGTYWNRALSALAAILIFGGALIFEAQTPPKELGKEVFNILSGLFLLSSLAAGVKQFAHAVRSHWGIENTCHWCLDITFREDESRIRNKHLRENFAWLNRFTLSLLKQHPGRDSIVMKRRSCGWSDGFLLEVLTGTTS